MSMLVTEGMILCGRHLYRRFRFTMIEPGTVTVIEFKKDSWFVKEKNRRAWQDTMIHDRDKIWRWESDGTFVPEYLTTYAEGLAWKWAYNEQANSYAGHPDIPGVPKKINVKDLYDR